MDCFIIKAISDELNQKICPIKITQIEQIASYTFVFKLYKEHNYYWLVLCAHPDLAYCYLTQIKPQKLDLIDNLSSPLLFALRKFLIGGLLNKIDTKSMERIFSFKIIPYQAGHEGGHLRLIFEIMGKKTNILIINEENNEILASMRSLTNQRYSFPKAPPNKLYPFEINRLELQEKLIKTLDLAREKSWSSLLVSCLFGITPIIAKEILYRSGIDDVKPNEGFPIPSSISSLWNELLEILDHYKGANQNTYFIFYQKGEKSPILSTIELRHLEDIVTLQEFPDINQAVENYYSDKLESLYFYKEKRRFGKFLRKERKRNNIRLVKINNDQKEVLKANEYRKMGDILMAHLNKIHKGMKEIVLSDIFCNNGNKKINITLDPTKSPADNASLYYRQYKKKKRSGEIINQRFKETRDYQKLITEAEKKLILVEDKHGLDSMAEEFNFSHMASTHGTYGTKIQQAKKNKTLMGIRRFLIDDKWEIFVGKNNKANDYLTRIVARSEDIWFHVYNAPGSHVILRNPKKQKVIPKNILEQAAKVAAFFSRRRNDEIVIVGYTPRKYVRKTKNLKPGMVLVDCQKTIDVKPDISGIISI